MNEDPKHKKFKLNADPESPDFVMLANVIREIESQGDDEGTAVHYATLMGASRLFRLMETFSLLNKARS